MTALKKIDSPRNPLIREALDVRDRHGRGREFMAEGPHLVESALASGAAISRVFLTEHFAKTHRALLERLKLSGSEIYEISERAFSKLSDTETPQGVLALVSIKPLTLADVKAGGPVVVADAVQDPGNLGTIIRTADAAGAGAVVLLEGTADAFSQKVLRASSGSIFNLPVVRAKRKTLSKELKEGGFRIVVTAPDASLTLFDADLAGPLALVFGNETKGVSPELKEEADLAVKIPLRGGAESLNVAASAAVVLYEVLRRGAMTPRRISPSS